jgi:hypothetical protein
LTTYLEEIKPLSYFLGFSYPLNLMFDGGKDMKISSSVLGEAQIALGSPFQLVLVMCELR